MFETIEIEVDARGVALLTLNRPEKRNAMSGAMIGEITRAMKQLGEDDAVRVVVLTGAAGVFCAGGDLNWMRAQISADRETRAKEAGKLAGMLGLINGLPKPVIARIEGFAFGGGVGLASVSDVAVCTPDTKFGLTETKLGLLPATIGPYVIARMGEGPARRVFMSSRPFGAEEAHCLGLVSQVTTELDAAVEAELRPYLSCAPGAVAEAKALALKLGRAPQADDIALSIDALVARWDSEEAKEGVEAFLAKRKPRWAEQ
ncbi:MAG: crotonase/enoyl-CoA hydratase family protein [Pseudomonadota bacterium]